MQRSTTPARKQYRYRVILRLPGQSIRYRSIRGKCSGILACALFLLLGASPAFAVAPVVTITAPSDGSSFDFGDQISFAAGATDDVDDEVLLTATIVWSSDVSGILGAGGAINVSTLTVGPHIITASVTDSELLSDSASINVTIANTAPTATAQSVSTAEDTAVAITLTGSDPEGSALTFTVAGGPGNGVLSGAAPNLTYTPDADFNGDDSFTFTVSDGLLTSAAATIDISVNAANDAPTANSDTVSTAEDVPVGITLTGSDPEGAALTFSVADGPDSGVLSGTAPNLTYTPDAGFNGADSFTFTVSDGEITSLAATVTITVDAVNDAPTANSDTVSTDEDVPVGITLTGSDPEGSALTFTVAAAPDSGVLSGAAPNLTYTPNADFNGGDSFTFTVSDGSATSVAATVTITVDAVNDAPTANSAAVSTDEDVPVGITLTGSDPEGSALTFTVAAAPDSGVLSGTAPNLTYTPNADFNGADSFTFTVNDGAATSGAATVTITVDAVNDAPTADDLDVSTDEDTPVVITLTGADPEGDALSFTLTNGPTKDGTLTGTAPNLTYTPDADFSGVDTFTFTVDDGDLESAEATVTITVSTLNDAPAADDRAVSTAEDTALAITLTGSDPEGDGLTFAIVDGPTNGTLSGTAPAVTYTPDADFNGADTFTFTVDDGDLTSTEATVTITVDAENDAPTADDQSVSTAEDTALAITLTGSDPEGDALSFAIVDGPTNGTLSGTAPAVTYTPDIDFSGTDTFTFTVSDGSATSAAATVTITINEGNDAPTADAQSVSTPEDTAVAITLTGSDPEGDPLTFAVTTEPANGTLTGTAPDLTYTPDLDFSGTDTFTFTVSDGAITSAEAAVTITVDAVNDAPAAIGQSASTEEDTPVAIVLTGSDTDSDLSILTFAIAGIPASGSLSGTAPNLTYTPNADFNGDDNFTFTVSDGELTSTEATVTITVDPLNDAPVLVTPIEEQFAIEGQAFLLDIAPDIDPNFVDADGDTLEFTASGLPVSGNLVFDGATGEFSGTPLLEDARDNEPYVIVVTATDNQPETVTPPQATFELNISALDRANVSLSISVAPDPALLDDEVQWTMTASNSNGPQAATNVVLKGSFVGEALTVSSNNSCNIGSAVGQVTSFDCMLGDLPVGGSAAVVFTSASAIAGDVVAFGTAESEDALPIDPVLEDNAGQLAVGVAEAFSNGAVQALGSAEVRSVAAGDVNGDGAVDLVVGTAAGQSIQIFLSGGFRDFATSAITVPDSSAHEGVALADFDGNGTLDLVVANGGPQPDVVYSNDGTGIFSLMATLGPTFAHDVAVGDFNNDGIPDIAIAAVQGNPVYLGDGSGGFVLESILGDANSLGVAVGKINADALDDLVFANVGSASQVWIRNAAGGFSAGAVLPIGDAVAVAIADLGGDTSPDLAFARIPAGTGDVPANPVLVNDGTGQFGNPAALLGVSPSSDIRAGDVNEDGLTDLVFINATGVHQIWTATGSGFALHREQLVDGDSVVGVLAHLGKSDVGDEGGVDLAMGGGTIAGLAIFLNDSFGNLGRGDAVPPVLSLNGEVSVTVPSGSQYADAGATATDNIDGDISTSIVVSNPVNTSLVGKYVVTYNVADFAGNGAAPITRTVTVTPAAGTGGGGGGAASPLLLMIMIVFIMAYASKRAIIPDACPGNNKRGPQNA